MNVCPRCARPVAMARATCVYCGAPLSAEQVAAAEAARAAALQPPAGETTTNVSPAPPEAATVVDAERRLVVADLDGVDVERLAAVLGLTAYEAGQRVRRGGVQLYRVTTPAEAEADAERLRAIGATVHVLADEDVREAARPVEALGGTFADGRLTLRADEGAIEVAKDELLLVVRGPITREYQTSGAINRVRTATLEAGYRIHLHRRAAARPLELDPGAFDFGAAPPLSGSSLLQINEWVADIAAGTPSDDGFRRLPPALGVSVPTTAGALGAAQALGRRPVAPGGKEPLPILDNVAQFRAYSAWRAAVERRRQG